jgi:hypothetical protein
MSNRCNNPATMWSMSRRIFVLIIVFLIVIDVVVRMSLPRYVYSDAHRLPLDDLQTMRLWKEKISSTKGVSVVFLGDSFLFGGGVRDENETIPWYAARQLEARFPGRQIEVCNLSLAGCTPADALMILRYIIDAKPDFVVYDVNIRWFNSDQQKVARTNLYRLTPGYVPPGMPGPDSLTVAQSAGESRLSAFVARWWALYRYRIPLDYLLFGQTPQQKVSLAIQEHSLKYLLPQAQKDTPEQLELYRPWYTKQFPADEMKVHVGGHLGDVTLNQNNAQWQSYREMISLLQKNNNSAAFMLIPRNWTLLEQDDLVSWPGFEENQGALADVARQAGITILDYTRSLPDQVFVDWSHPNAAGNEQMARLLTDDLQKTGLLTGSEKQK